MRPAEYHIILTDEALSDLARIAEFIRTESPQGAPVVAETILDAIDSLALMPARFKRVGQSRKRGSSIHAMVVFPFIVRYRVDEPRSAVHVLSVRRGSRRLPRGSAP